MLAAGLAHAAFEDWMFAVGYYLSVFFWAMAFILVDLLPETASAGYPNVAFAMPEQKFEPATVSAL